MLSSLAVQQQLTGAWRLMLGKAEGLRLLDISADGFWNSFFAMVLALPPLAITWATMAADMAGRGGGTSTSGLVARLAMIDLGSWVIPIVVLAFAARPARIADRFVHYVVAANWGSAITVWMMIPATLVRVFAPEAVDLFSLTYLVLFIVTLFLSWRLTTMAIGKGPGMGTAVFSAMFGVSLVVLFALQALVGLPAPA